jgi:hypothetical protein
MSIPAVPDRHALVTKEFIEWRCRRQRGREMQ